MSEFEIQVKRSLREQKISQEALSRQVDYSHSYVNKVLNGQRSGSVMLFRKLSEFTGVSLDTLKESA